MRQDPCFCGVGENDMVQLRCGVPDFFIHYLNLKQLGLTAPAWLAWPGCGEATARRIEFLPVLV